MRSYSCETKARPTQVLNDVTAWDTEYVPQRDALEIFNTAIRNSSLPWANDLKSTSDFKGRVETRSHALGALTRVRVSPHTCSRSTAEIRASYEDCVYATIVLGGAMQVEQGDRTSVARSGDIHLFRGDIPITVSMAPEMRHQVVVMMLSKEVAERTFKDPAMYTNIVLQQDKMAKPLQACTSFLAENFLTATRDEIDAIVQATLSLMPISISSEGGTEQHSPIRCQEHLRGKIRQFIELNIADPDLSPAMAAEHFGVSRRYIHKVLATGGLTFTACVLSKRLDQIRQELASSSGRRQPISSLAYQWGFENLSTFNRAFKRQFGCSPSRYRLSQ